MRMENGNTTCRGLGSLIRGVINQISPGAGLGILIGKKVQKIFMNESHLQFKTNKGTFTFEAEGDCCSDSVFYDFIGVERLLRNKLIKAIEVVDLDLVGDEKQYQSEILVYGYRIITEDEKFGEVSSVFSFRNYSNGYYGGWIRSVDKKVDVKPELKHDVLCTDNLL